MKPTRYFPFVIFFAIMLHHGSRAETAAETGEPPYKTLYENGEYDEAIAAINDSLANDSSNARQLLFYLASCHIARGDRDQGAMTFKRLLGIAPAFQLDSLLTPPKIFEIFRTVRAEEAAARPPSPLVDARLSPFLSIPLGFAPLGAGQFYRRERLKGALLFAAQAASIAVCVWAAGRKDHFESSRYGWYEGNRWAYERYTNYARIGFGIGVGTYVLGVAEYFLGNKKK